MNVKAIWGVPDLFKGLEESSLVPLWSGEPHSSEAYIIGTRIRLAA